MNRTVVSAGLLVLLSAGFLIFLVLTAPLLPERLANHFNGSGRPNGWMSRTSHVCLTAALGVLLPLVVVGGIWLLRHLPTSLINVPRRDYWLAPERLRATHDRLMGYGLWLASLLVLFTGGMHGLVLHANRQDPPTLSPSLALGLVFGFAAGILVWVAAFLWHFAWPPKRPPPAAR